MSKAEKFIQDYTRKCSNECWWYAQGSYYSWLTPDQARRAVEIAREEAALNACKCYCDDICEKGMCGMCFHKHDGKGQIKKSFKYNECNELKMILAAINNN